ncbi:MAG: hypothetical protein WBV60_09560 [Terriglobales bacterium]
MKPKQLEFCLFWFKPKIEWCVLAPKGTGNQVIANFAKIVCDPQSGLKPAASCVRARRASGAMSRHVTISNPNYRALASPDGAVTGASVSSLITEVTAIC